MRSMLSKGKLGPTLGVSLFVTVLGALGCGESADPNKAYSSLAICVLGKGADAAPVERMKTLRLLQLSNPNADGKSDTWPGRCATYADQLYKSLDGSGATASLKRSMQSKLGCSDEKPACVLNQETVLTMTGELADGAKTAGLKVSPVPGVKEPEVTVALALSVADWQPIHKEASAVIGPELASDGRAYFMVKTKGERTRPVGCTFAPGGKGLECFAASDKLPALPPQSVALVTDDKDIITTGLTEKGLSAFDLKTGNEVVAKGMTGNLLREGLAVERGDGDKGYVAIPLAKGKAGKPVELKSKGTIEQPLSLGSQLVWIEPGEGGNRLVVKGQKGARLTDVTSQSGAFQGPLHVCRSGTTTVVAAFAPHSGQRGAKATSGSDKTQVTVAIMTNGAWSKPVEAQIPFQRAIESGLVCRDNGATMAWAQPGDGTTQVGQLTCDKDGCKTAQANLAGIDSRWWWSVGPVGDKLLVMWRAGLGEARMRIAPLAQLDQAKDIVLFDDQEHDGPKAGEATSVFTGDTTLLLFKQDPPVALGISADGTAKVLTAK